MKDFMLIFMGEDYQSMGMDPEQMQDRYGRWFAWNQKMRADGVVKNGEALHTEAKRVSGKDRVVTDGPFVEGKDLVGGFYIVQATDMDGALKIAEGYPDYDIGGTVEIREVMVFDGQ